MANPLAGLNGRLHHFFGNSDANEAPEPGADNAGIQAPGYISDAASGLPIAADIGRAETGLVPNGGPANQDRAQTLAAEGGMPPSASQYSSALEGETYGLTSSKLLAEDMHQIGVSAGVASAGYGSIDASSAIESTSGDLASGGFGAVVAYGGVSNDGLGTGGDADSTFERIDSSAEQLIFAPVSQSPADQQIHSPATGGQTDVVAEDLADNGSVLQAAGGNPLDGVNSWLYHLGNVDAAEGVRIGANNAGLVVIDYEVDTSSGTRGHTPAELNVMRGGKDKLVVSYLSIGEAEDYRFYWQSNWDTNPPSFLSASNPEWPDNYKVKYWDPAWQSIMFTYVDKIIAAGFNGVYMDIIDAYQYWEDINPVPGMNYAQKMADFVAAIRAHAEAKLAALGDTRDFVIMGQNGEELLENATYRNALDGVGKEDLRFYYENGHEEDFQPTPNGWYSGSKPFLELAEANDVQVFVVEYMTQARQTQYASTLEAEMQYLHDHGIPLYVSEDRDLTSIFPQPPGIEDDLPIMGTNIAEVLSGTESLDIIYALGGNDTVKGLGGNDAINGGIGADSMYGGLGNDTFYVDNASDRLFEAAGQGSDRVVSAVGYALAAGQEIELLATASRAGTGAINLTGNAFAQRLDGNYGNNLLNGGGGADQMYGFWGNDIFYVDNAGDKVFEVAGQGSDAAYTSVSYVLGAGQSIELLATTAIAGTGAIKLTGNDFNQRINGNAGNNVISGGGGADQMYGFGGNDSFVVDNAGDRVFESAGGGNDTVFASASFVLSAGQEIEQLATASQAGTTAINLTGNALSQALRGNDGKNVLNGGGGPDTLYGFNGNDILYVDNAGDRVFEAAGGGSDRVYSSVSYALATGQQIEWLATTSQAGTAAINLTGNELSQTVNGNNGVNSLNGAGGNDRIYGQVGNDYVNGGLGNDVLSGGLGNDRFVFNTTLNASTNVDTISDYNATQDTVQLENAVFTALTTTGSLAASQFWASTAGVAHDANDRIIYDTDSGALYYDPDGTGAAARIQFAVLTGHPALTSTDFLVV